MFRKFSYYRTKAEKTAERIYLVEIVKLHLLAFAVVMVLLMISHLLIAGEFGFCYWSLKRGWIWKN